MTAAVPGPSGLPRTALAESRLILWLAFVAAHVWLGFLNLWAPGLPLGDVTIQYQAWAQQADFHTFYVGIDSAWVYPIVALVPMVLTGIAGFAHYGLAWLVLVSILDAIAFFALVGWRRDSRSSPVLGWWWIGFLVLLGPIALGRIDSITVPLCIVAVLFLASRPQLASVLLTIATWIKVWPAAILAAILIARRGRTRVIVAAAATSVIIVGIALALGSGGNVLSFVTQQTGRGLQIEAPVSTAWMWMSFARVPGAFVYYDTGILTYQVAGPGVSGAASLMSLALAFAILAICALGGLGVIRGASTSDLLPSLSLALISGFIAFDKVGSPQYITWLSVPVILGLATHAMGRGQSFRIPAAMVLVIAVLTQTIYPYLYDDLLALNPLLLSILTIRNVMIFVLLAWSVATTSALARRSVSRQPIDDADGWLPTVWPFGVRIHSWTAPRAATKSQLRDRRAEPAPE